MRKLSFGAAAVASLLSVGGCATMSGSGGISTAEVEADAKLICSFDPTAAAVANVLSAAPDVALAENVAQIICAAVTAAPAASGKFADAPNVRKTITVNGKPVTITGTFSIRLRANGLVSTTAIINGKRVTITGAFLSQ